jgi:putative ABC transport system permease protein
MADRLTTFDLVLQNLFRKPFRTTALVCLVALFSFFLLGGTIISLNVGNGTRMMAERLGADVLFVPYGYEEKVQSSLLRGEPSSFYMNSGLAAALAREPGVDGVTTQLFIATLKASCCVLPVQLIGIDPRTDFVVRPWMASVRDKPLSENEIVVGSKIFGEPGDTLQFFGKDFTIAARLDETGMGFDASVFLDIDRARRLLLLSELAPRLNLPENMDRNAIASSVLVKFAPFVDVRKTVNELLRKYAADYDLDFVLVAGMITDISARLGVFSSVFYGFAGVLWLLAVTVLGLVFSSAARERKREFGLLKIIGASRRNLVWIVLDEALLVSAAGALAGVGSAALILFMFRDYINAVLQTPSLGSDGIVPLLVSGCVFLLGLLTGPLACVPAIRGLGRLDAYASAQEGA